MANNRFLEKRTRLSLYFFIMGLLFLSSCSTRHRRIRVAISPYQDIAMIVNIKNLELEKKYGTSVKLYSMNWEDILPSVASVGKGVDMGFGSLTEYLTKYANLNKNTKDPVLFIYPAYIYKGGGFMTFNGEIPEINRETIVNDTLVREFLSYKIGAQKNSIYEMIIYSLAKRAGVPFSDIRLFDIQLNDGFLASQGKNPAIDITSVGLTQITEGMKHNGRLVLEIEDAGFADITGFICKNSIYDKYSKDVENVIRMWFDCTSYVLADIEDNSEYSRRYLDEKAATKYSLEQYQTALSQEYFPLSIEEAKAQIISDTGRFSYSRISSDIIDYLHDNQIVTDQIPLPEFIKLLSTD